MGRVARFSHLVRGFIGRVGADNLNTGYVSQQNHVVVGGCGRSGTTLVRVLLDSHPHLCCGPESRVFFADPLKMKRIYHRFKLEQQPIRECYQSCMSRAEFVDRFAEICCRATGKQRWAEKSPRNVLHLELLFNMFPNAKFVHVLRDGRDVACSLRTHPRHRVKKGKVVAVNTWKPFVGCVERWRDSLHAIQPFSNDPRVHTVRYEELVTNSRPCIEKLLQFLDEPWDDALLSHNESTSAFRDPTTFPQNAEAIKPIKTSALSRWQRDMSDEDKQIFKAIAGELLIESGYAADNDW